MTERERLIGLINAKQVYGIDQDQPRRHDMLLLDNEDLADYLLANGVIVTPVAVGQTVWFVRNGKVVETSIDKVVVKHGGLYFKMGCNGMYETAVSAIGKTVFPSREEAEKALERSRG